MSVYTVSEQSGGSGMF